MENNQDKIWQNIKPQVQNYEPDEYTSADWDEMETVLEAKLKPPGFINGIFYPKLLLLLVLGISLALVLRAGFGKYLATDQHYAASQVDAITSVEQPAQRIAQTSNIEIDEQEKTQEQTLILSGEKEHFNRDKGGLTADLTEGRVLEKKSSFSPKQKNTTTQEFRMTKSSEEAFTKNTEIEREGTSTSLNIEPSRQEFDELQEPQKEVAFNHSPILPIPTLETMVAREAEGYQGDIPRSDPKVSGKWRLGLTFGINTTVTDYERKTMSSLPFIGIFARKSLNSKWELQLETQFKPVANYNVTQHYEEEVYSSVGYLGTGIQEWTYRAYTSVELPVVLKYAASDRTGLLFGARYSFISIHGPSSSSSGSYYYYNEPLFNRTPMKGFWGSDVGLIVGAEHYLGGRWLLSIRYAQGLRDITPDNLYNDTKTHLNSDLQLAAHHYF